MEGQIMKLYSLAHVGEMFGLTRMTVEKWVWKYKLPYIETEPGKNGKTHFYMDEIGIEAFKAVIMEKHNLN
jgi:hypothetical protein